MTSTTQSATSTWPRLFTAESTIRSFIRCIGLWMPGVSKSTIWPSGRLTTARMRLRVVCGLSETMATFWPTIWFTRVDLPTFGRPTTATNPGLHRLVLRRLPAEAHAVDPLALGVHDLDHEAAVVDPLARARDAAEGRRHQAADRPHVVAVGERGLQRLLQPVDVHAAGDQERAVGLDADRLRLQVVLVLDLAHDLLDDVLHRHQAGDAAVLVDGDREGDPAGLELLQQLRDLLRLRHQVGLAHQRPQRIGGRPVVLDEVAHAHHARRCRRGSRRRPAPGCTSSRAGAGAGRRWWTSRARATMSGRGVITSRTWVTEKRATASTRRPSFSSCTGAGGTSGTGAAPLASASSAVGRRGAAAQRGRQRAQRPRVGVEDGQQHEQRALGVAPHQAVGQGQAEEQQVQDHEPERARQRPRMDVTVLGEQHGDDHGHDHVRGVGAHVDGHEQGLRVLEVAVDQLRARVLLRGG